MFGRRSWVSRQWGRAGKNGDCLTLDEGRTRMDGGRAWTRDMFESWVANAEDEEAEALPGDEVLTCCIS